MEFQSNFNRFLRRSHGPLELRARARARRHTHTHTHTHTRTHARTHARTPDFGSEFLSIVNRFLRRSRGPLELRARARTHKHKYTHTHKHTLTHAHRHAAHLCRDWTPPIPTSAPGLALFDGTGVTPACISTGTGLVPTSAPGLTRLPRGLPLRRCLDGPTSAAGL